MEETVRLGILDVWSLITASERKGRFDPASENVKG